MGLDEPGEETGPQLGHRRVGKVGEDVVFDVPHRVRISDGWVAADLALLEAPLGQRLGGAGEDALDKVVVELEP